MRGGIAVLAPMVRPVRDRDERRRPSTPFDMILPTPDGIAALHPMVCARAALPRWRGEVPVFHTI